MAARLRTQSSPTFCAVSRAFDLPVAVVNVRRHRDAGVAAIRHLVSNEMRFRVEFGLANFVALVAPDVLPVLAEYPELFSLAEELGYRPYETFKITGEKPAALCIVGTKQPDAAVRIALSRLHDPDTPDGELYASVVARFAKSDAVALLLDCVLRDPPTRVVESIGRELGHLDATAAVVDWLKSPAVENRLAACRVAGFLPHSEGLDAEVRGRADDTNRRIADAAVRSHERLQRSRTVDELLTAIAREADKTHRWVLLDAMVAVADPEGGTWTQAVRSTLSPAESRYLSERMKERGKELTEELNREDR
jgi:hypothetical protein